MSISSQISRIIGLRDQIRNKLTIMGLVTSNSKLEDLTEAILDIPMQDTRTYTPGTRNQTISAGMYLTGTQTIQGDTNLIAENIADGVSIFGVAGTHTGGTDTSDATLTSGGQMLAPYTAYSDGQKYTGTIQAYGGTVEAMSVDPILDNNSWAVISSVAKAGKGSNYWSVGDAKEINLLGRIGTFNINTTLYVFIIGLNHQNINGITFQGFKTAQTNGIDVCLIDENYSETSSSGTKYFSMNHWGNKNYGGWMASSARYDILGSTDIAPSEYGDDVTTTSIGYNASTNTAKTPVENTLMSCLPLDLRNVMRPMTVYTDNKGNSSNVSENVTASIDYLPLLSEFEVLGERTNANQYEQELQAQYEYYSVGNSAVKYRHSSTTSTAIWWCRSPRAASGTAFTHVSIGGKTGIATSYTSQGIAPMFMV